ncbi:MAG: hypothetical protein ICV62_15885 [Cyanobacteria bacterium Co-bin13]|nr:hypothetical protein [Cyanobacteria bacterium Co-bin13]
MALLQRIASAALGLGILSAATAAQADAPGVFYSWRALDANVTQCLDRAGQALASQNLEGIQADLNSVGGSTDETTAIFVCLEDEQSTTVMVIVSGANEEAAVSLREALKSVF